MITPDSDLDFGATDADEDIAQSVNPMEKPCSLGGCESNCAT